MIDHAQKQRIEAAAGSLAGNPDGIKALKFIQGILGTGRMGQITTLVKEAANGDASAVAEAIHGALGSVKGVSK